MSEMPIKELQDIREVFQDLKRKWKTFLLVFIVSVLAAGVTWKLVKPNFEAKCSWIPSQQSMASSSLNMAMMASLGGSLGLNVGGSSDLEQFYSDIIVSSDFLMELVGRRWKMAKGNVDSMTLVQYYEVDTTGIRTKSPKFVDVERAIKESAVAKLRSDISFESGKLNQLNVKTKDPALSYAILQVLLAKIIEYSDLQRVGKAKQELQFTQERLIEYESKLKSTEQRYQYFLQSNLDLTSPRVMLQRQALERDISLQTQLVTQFRTRFEQTKLDLIKKQEDFVFVETPKQPNTSQILLKLLIVFFVFFSINFVFLVIQFLRSWLVIAFR